MVNEDEAALPDVGKTALGVVAIRALESTRSDRLFDDPLAAKFVAASGGTLDDWRHVGTATDDASRRYWEAMQRWVVVRTHFLDHLVVDACASGCTQVVVLGAGLDTRAFRLPLPAGVRFFELDLPEVLEFKQAVVASSKAEAASSRSVIPGDLTADWPTALAAAGWTAAAPTAWIAEGLLVYLSPDQNEELFARVSAGSAPGSRLGVTVPDPDRQGSRMARPAALTRLWRSEGIQDPGAWLGRHGWDARVFDATERATAYGRGPAATAPDRPRSGARLVDAIRPN